MNTFIILIFILGYFAISFENFLKINKAASALITATLCWVLLFNQNNYSLVNVSLMHHLGNISAILFFLLGAMTIVEIIDSHNGFDIITQKIKTNSKKKLLYIIAAISFCLSAFLDNLTTAIIMASICSKILTEPEDKWWFSGAIIIAANAGGAFSPLGDVTSTMLWIGNQISALEIVKLVFFPSLFVCLIPIIFIAKKFTNKKIYIIQFENGNELQKKEGKIILFAGIFLLIFVPIFKTITHLPPFMGMLLAVGFMWIITSFMHKKKDPLIAKKYTVANALQKIDTPSILFFLGILLAVAALDSSGILKEMAFSLTHHLKNNYLIGTALGLVSAVLDNVPLVAAAQGMFSAQDFPTDHLFWHFIALSTGTGGSIIIIGSAAGVAVMGINDIPFMWYLKKIGGLALLGFLSGIIVFLLQIILLT